MERERPPMTTIEVLGAPGTPRFAGAGERPVRVGSLPECEVRLSADPPGVRALFVRLDDRWFVAEAASADLHVNGARIFQAPLADGDRVSVCGVALTVRLSGAVATTQTPAAPVDRELERAVKRFPGLAKVGVVLARTLHVGASGVFFKARWSRHPAAPVVVRLLAPHLVTDENAMFRFCRGVTAAGDLRAPNLLRLYRAGKTGDGWYLISEYARGGSLRDVVKEPSSPRRRARLAAKIGVDVSRALEAIAAAGLVHRAIAPSAVFFDDEGTAKLGDFTLARGQELETLRRFTMAGDAIGGHAYTAPEQALGSTNLDIRADVYSLGAAMYFAATGRPPLEGKTLVELVDAICRRKPAPPSSVNAEVPPALDRAILKALAKDPAERFASPADFRAALEPMLGG